MNRLDKKVAWVTGGASGLGKAIAHRLAFEGATVVISDTQRHLGETTAAEGGFTFFDQDVCDETQWSEIVTKIERQFEHLNVLVNNAGVLGPTDANPETVSLASWRKILSVNVEGVFLGCRAAIPAMRRAGNGSIINLSSVGARMALPRSMAYGASKAAVRSMTKSVAQHCAEQGINVRCNSVDPGFVPTPMVNLAMEDTARQRGVPFDQVLSELRSNIPLGDFTRPEDVAAAVAFLASDDARHMTGSALLVDGGLAHCNTYRGRVV
jgi:NAD(P)-dependent dehydrogenase (short-subunit alcohol dehydrogenase family)